jgi:multidrug efflux pump subunit AcrA (membrane-fusion protein)
MPVKAWLQLLGFAVLVVAAASLFVAWSAVRKQQDELQAQLKSAQEQLQAADARETSSKKALQQQLAKIAQERKSVQTPAEAIEELPTVLPLPKPLVIENSVPLAAGDVSKGAGTAGSKPEAAAPKVELPAEDLKPLYDYALGCKTCQAQLAATEAELNDEKAKTQTLGRERDDALRVAHGGSVIQRVAHAAKWFVIGAAAGAVAAKLAR